MEPVIESNSQNNESRISNQENTQTQNSNSKLKITDFNIIRNIGKGSFGKVFMAKNLRNDKLYAVKAINKHFIEKEEKVHEIHIERYILSTLQHPNVLRLHYTFQDKKKLYFVLELGERGDLKEFIKSQSILSYDLAKFFAAEIVNGLEYIHSKGIVHRDIKPENMVLNDKFHIKIADFGTAIFEGKYFCLEDKKFIDYKENEEIIKSFVGTAEYISPEMIENEICSYEADLWALGCIIYQFFHRNPPFTGVTYHLIIQKIKNREPIVYSEDLPHDAKDIISKLLIFDPKKRLGSQKEADSSSYSLREIKNHPFFNGIDFDNLHNQEVPFRTNAVIRMNSNSSSPNKPTSNPDTPTNSDIEIINYYHQIPDFQINVNYFGSNISLNSESGLGIEKKESLNQNKVVIYEGIVKKKSPWFHFNTRRLVLLCDRIEYYNPINNEKRGEIKLNKNCIAIIKDESKFEVSTPDRVFFFKVENFVSKEWCSQINSVIKSISINKELD